MPIIDWTKQIEDEFIKKYQVPLSKAYTEYKLDRTGCCMCPYAKCPADVTKRLQVLYEYEPGMYKYAMKVMKPIYIAQNIKLSFDQEYEKDRENMWTLKYEQMRYEMMKKYRPEKCENYKPTKYTKIRLF